jgi:hypothetical protein
VEVEDDIGVAKWVPCVSERREERGVPVREEGELGRGLFHGLGPDGARRPFLFFSFSFLFSFSEFFENFANKP